MISVRQASKLKARGESLQGVSAEIETGEFVTLIGDAGSGKSLFLRLFNALVNPDDGQVFVLGQNVQHTDLFALRRLIGWVGPDPDLFSHMTVSENVGLGLRIAGAPADEVQNRVEEVLDLVGLSADIGTRRPGSLGPVDQLKAALARALASDPELLLLDVPAAGLTPFSRLSMHRQIRAIHDSLGLTTIMTCTQPHEALALGDRVLVFAAGGIIADTTRRDWRDAPMNAYARSMLEAAAMEAAAAMTIDA